MVLAAPPVPTRFPCWCRAVYSWGGEGSRDLGFIEGDLIECVNAGDGSWWTGRLWRDRRTVGSFPSNFVQVLPSEFRPTSRSVSPLPPTNAPAPQDAPPKSKVFRKPFEAYSKAPHYTTAKQVEAVVPAPVPIHRGTSHYPDRAAHASSGGLHADIAPVPDPALRFSGHGYGSRAPSPEPLQPPSTRPLRASSPRPLRASSPRLSRSPIPSPVPSFHAPSSPRPEFENTEGRFNSLEPESPPPPVPPPHRHIPSSRNASLDDSLAVSRQGSNASYQAQRPSRQGSRNYYFLRSERHLSRHDSHVSYTRPDAKQHSHVPSPHRPPTPENGRYDRMTPSPLREAMDDVIEQLDALGMQKSSTASIQPSVPLDPWSPESFNLVTHQARRKGKRAPSPIRPQTALGTASSHDEGYETWSGGSSYHNALGTAQKSGSDVHLPQLDDYVDRMEGRIRRLHNHNSRAMTDAGIGGGDLGPDVLPLDDPHSFQPPKRPSSSLGARSNPEHQIRHRKSAFDMSRAVPDRTLTTKTTSTNTTNSSSATQSSSRSLMSGASASAYSATSAGSYARRTTQQRTRSALGLRETDGFGDGESDRPETPFTGVTYHSSHASASSRPKSQSGWHDAMVNPEPEIGGLVPAKAPRRSIFRKILDSARTGVASGRTSIALGSEAGSKASSSRGRASSPIRSALSAISGSNSHGSRNTDGMPMIGIGSGVKISTFGRQLYGQQTGPVREVGLFGAVDWVQVRRDVNRSNSLSRMERQERRDRCEMLDHLAIRPVEEFFNSWEGDEGGDGLPIEQPAVNCQALGTQLAQVDKHARFVGGPGVTGTDQSATAASLAVTFVCRPYRSDMQRLRAIFTWVAEKICWEEDVEGAGPVDTQRAVQTRRACAEEYAVVVREMCGAVGVRCEVVRGYLKAPGEVAEVGVVPRSNHWWNAVVVDGEWRMMDCCLASPSNPQRGVYSGAGGSTADGWWFLTRPSELCWTHIAERYPHQHLCPPAPAEVLLALPWACAAFFRLGMRLVEYDTSVTRIEDLEMVHIRMDVPEDVELAAEVEVRTLSRDSDGDRFESGETARKRALAQAEWYGGVKRYAIKAVLPGDEGHGVLRVYAGRRGLMHTIKDIPHPLAFALPIVHTGENPSYEFVTRHPTPHAQRHDIYVVQPQCRRLALNNTFVFAIRQHPSSLPGSSASSSSSGKNTASSSGLLSGAPPLPAPYGTFMSGDMVRPTSPIVRPSSAVSITASNTSGSNPSTSNSSSSGGSGGGSQKPAKLAIQTPGGKILRLMRKEDHSPRKGSGGGSGGRSAGSGEAASDGGTWETIIKCSEKGVWRGLVLADRTARWCVFAEWECVG